MEPDARLNRDSAIESCLSSETAPSFGDHCRSLLAHSTSSGPRAGRGAGDFLSAIASKLAPTTASFRLKASILLLSFGLASSIAQTPPSHAYSPFDPQRQAQSQPKSKGDFDQSHVVIKLKPEALASSTGPQKMSAQTFGVAGLGAVTRVFPTAAAPIQKASASATPEPLPPDLRLWMRAELTEGASVEQVVQDLQKSSLVAVAEPDYLYKLSDEGLPKTTGSASAVAADAVPATGGVPRKMSGTADIPDNSTDPLLSQQWHLDAAKVKDAWAYLKSQGLPPGGNRDIIIAVIDSGVDYTHPDLAPNMWTNSREIAGNGLDDDGDGIIDDVHGASFVGSSFDHKGDPMDDNGHGTHVAGIIAAAANNGVGGVGIAYNCQIMAIKAAQYSGVLASSDIAEGINYAVEHGADIINMSFGGPAQSKIVEDSLTVAFGQAVLVAAAGNSSIYNEGPGSIPSYPAAYIYVLGVMAQQQTPDPKTGAWLARFSNWDNIPNSRIEYELMAPGVAIPSTLPGNQYAAWSGTSMAAPVVSGIAALVRTRFPDKNVYSSRFIMGQIAASGPKLTGVAPEGADPISYYSAEALKAVSTTPEPELKLLDHWLFDGTSIDAANDGDGIVDAGETIDLAIVIKNRWGKADPTSVKLVAQADGATGPCPYVTWVTDTVDYGAVGNFGEDDNGLIYDAGNVITGVRYPFRFKVSNDCPNGFIIPIKVTMTCGNGFDAADPKAPYTFTGNFTLTVMKGRELPRVISENMTLTKDYYWIVPDQTLIEKDVTVTIQEGTQVQFWAPPAKGIYTGTPITPYNTYLRVDGCLLVQGTAAEPVELFNAEYYPLYPVTINGNVKMSYVKIQNPWVSPNTGSTQNTIDHAYFCQFSPSGIDNGGGGRGSARVSAYQIKRSVFYKLGIMRGIDFSPGNQQYENLYDSCKLYGSLSESTDNVFLRNFRDGDNMTSSYDAGALIVSGNFKNNAILNWLWNPNLYLWLRIMPGANPAAVDGNFWGTTTRTLIDLVIKDYNDDFNMGRVTYDPILTTPATTTYPFVVDVVLTNGTGQKVTRVGAESLTFTVTFNRDMNTAKQPLVSFGPDTPVTDYTVHPIDGGWSNARTWAGSFATTPITGDGYQLVRVAGAVAADDPWLVTGDDAGRFRFEIVTSGVEALTLQANGGEGYVDLSWTQTDFELLAGYNVYRATSETGTYTRINSSIIPAQTKQFRDRAVQPGQKYYYKFTVVQTDMSESAPSNIADGTPKDTIPPVITHTPLTTAEPNLSLSFAADITDNVAVTGATFYYRKSGDTIYQSRAMVNVSGNRWSVSLEGANIVAPGVEYYLSATDGVSTTLAGRPEQPYLITVQDMPVITSVSPATGGIAGGTTVTITGSNFKAGVKVYFGSALATNIVVVSPTQITCTVPTAIPAKVTVKVEGANGASSTLVNGFTFIDATPTVYLPDLTAYAGAILTVPLDVANVNGLVAADITVTFPTTLLHIRQATVGALVSGWQIATNTATAGQVRLSMAAGGAAVQGSGTLANLEFDVIGSSGQSGALTVTSAKMNDGAITAQTINGSLTINVGYSIAGTVRYWSDYSRAVSGVMHTLEGNGTQTTTGATDGTYRFENLPNVAYSVTPQKSDQVSSITAYDAALVLQHAAGLTTLTGSAAIAADVNLNGEITAMDAYQILQHAAGLESLTVPTGGKVWVFSPASRTYAALTTSQTGQDFTAILRGDVSGNWLSTTGQGGASVKVGIATVADTAANRTYAYLLLQADTIPVYGIDLLLSYSTASSIVATVAPTTSSALNTMTAGKIQAALAKAEGLTGNQILLAVTFAGTANPLLTLDSISLNEGAVLAVDGADPAVFDNDGNGQVDTVASPSIKTQPASQTVNQDASATFTVVAAGNPTPTYQWRKGSTAIAGATGKSYTIASVQPGDAGNYSVAVANSLGSTLSEAAALTVNLPPTITQQPKNQAAGAGQSVTFTVAASGTPPFSYRWKKDGTAIAGATGASFTIGSVATADAGLYTVVVSNGIQPDATSSQATLTVLPAGTTATHAIVGSGFVAGSTLTITNTLTYPGTASSIGWQVVLPTGWSYASSGGSAGETRPAVGATEVLGWAWTTLPASPVTFTYTLNVPARTTGDITVQAFAILRSGGDLLQILAKPDPLVIAQAPDRHSADTNADGKLSLLELTRVIALYNTRNGTVRTGCYSVQEGSEDGFAPEPTRALAGTLTLTRYHSADTDKDGKVSLVELTRVIELYNTRAGTTRTGQYHVQAGTEDGFAPGP
jgi:subtilisin family serine protease